jgi:hypothetical protein
VLWRRALLVLLVFGGAACSPSTRTVDAGDEPAPAATTTATGVSDLARFAGVWQRHGITIEVTETGALEATYRVYAWCDDAPEPCDSMEGSTIISGGHLVGRLESFTPRSAKATIESDTADLVGHLGPAVFELLDDGKARLDGTVLCSETTTFRSECGA